MGFFNFLETLFFISLAITFVLIIMLVYHFKGRLVVLEQKANTMFEILSSMIKEMKDIRESTSVLSNKIDSIERSYSESVKVEPNPAFSPSMPFGGGAGGLFPPELFRLFQMGGQSPFQANEYADEDDEDYEGEEGEFKKIVVSDTELDSDDDDNDDVRVISVDIDSSTQPELGSLDELKEEDIVLDDDEPEVLEDGDDVIELDDEPENELDVEGKSSEKSNEDTEHVDYRKLDVSYLRTMVLTRGLATDTKKLKKPDLIRLLEG